MIRAIVGVPGAGKSLYLVERAQYYLKRGRTVYSNFPIKGCHQFSLDDLIDYAFPENSIVIIDEAGRLFNARNWKDLPSEVFDMFTMHRHLNIEMYIGVQAFNRIDTSLREVIEVTYVAQKGLFGLRHYYRGYYEVQRVGKIKGSEDLFASIWFPWRIYKYYDTFAMKSVWQDKPMIPLRPYEPLPLTIKERVIGSINQKVLAPVMKKFNPSYGMDQEEKERYDYVQLLRKEYQDFLYELPYEDSLHIQNNGLEDWLKFNDAPETHIGYTFLYYLPEVI